MTNQTAVLLSVDQSESSISQRAVSLSANQKIVLTNKKLVDPPVPAVLEVRHGVAEALNLHGAHLGVEGEVGEVHGARGLEGEHQSEASIVQIVDQSEASIVQSVDC